MFILLTYKKKLSAIAVNYTNMIFLFMYFFLFILFSDLSGFS